MRRRAALIEKLECRRLLSGGPVILATFPSGGINSRVAADAGGDVFGTTPHTGDSAGSIVELPAGSTTVKTLATFGPNGGANTLGFDPGSILVDSAGDLFGTAESDKLESYPYTNTPFMEIWELPANGSAVQVLFSQLAPLALNSMDPEGDLLGSGSQVGVAGFGSESYAYVFTRAGQTFGLAGQSLVGYPYPIGTASDAAGDAYTLITDTPIGGRNSVEEETAGSLSADSPSTIYSFADLPAATPAGIASDAAGDVFVTAGSTVVEIKAETHAETILATLNGTTDGSTFGGAPVADAAGDVFATTTSGGADGYGTLVELPAGQNSFTTLLSFNTPGGASQLSGPGPYQDQGAGMTVNSAGILFGTLPDGSNTDVFEWPGLSSPLISPTPGATTGLRPALGRSTIPPTLVANARFTGAVRVNLTTLPGGAAAGTVKTTLYATNGGSGIALGQISQHRGARTQSLAATFHIATTLASGFYNLVARSTDAAGNVVTSALGEALTVNPPLAKVSGSIVSITPRLQPGQGGSLILQLINTGNIASTLPVTIDITVDDAWTLVNQTVRLKVPDNRWGVRVKFRYTLSPYIGGNTFAPLISVTEDGLTTTTTSTKTFTVY